MTQLEKLQVLTGRTDKDALLTVLLEQAQEEFKQICNREDVPANAENVVNSMVVEKYNRFGTEGLAAQSFSGTSENFVDGYTAHILTALSRFRKARFL